MPEEKKTEEKQEKKEEKPTLKDNLVVTKHSVRIRGKEIKYTVTAGTMILKEETADREKESEGEKPRAQVFFVAYVKDGDSSKSKRPLTFSFNGDTTITRHCLCHTQGIINRFLRRIDGRLEQG